MSCQGVVDVAQVVHNHHQTERKLPEVSLHIFFFALSSYCFIIPHPAGRELLIAFLGAAVVEG